MNTDRYMLCLSIPAVNLVAFFFFGGRCGNNPSVGFDYTSMAQVITSFITAGRKKPVDIGYDVKIDKIENITQNESKKNVRTVPS